MKRRTFIGTATAAAAAAGVAPVSTTRAQKAGAGPGAGSVRVRVENGRVLVDTATLSAVLEKGMLVSLKRKDDGAEMIAGADPATRPALELLYRGGATLPVDEAKFGSITARSLSNTRAEVIFHGWDGDGILAVTACPLCGDLILEPSTYSSRPGVRACRWNIRGIRSGLRLVAPFFQGVNLELDDPIIANTRWNWPYYWEAGLAIFQGADGGFWVHNRDTNYRYKALQVGLPGEARAVGLESEAYGPIDDNLSAGGLSWRINVHRGDWQVPAAVYRDWYRAAYGAGKEAENRRDWVRDVSFAVCWCPTDTTVLDALAKKVDPGRTLIHLPNWRTDKYDENYPAYIADSAGAAFIARAKAMGFRIMPHFNAIDMDPSNPAYAYLRDFQYRDIETGTLEGWSYWQGRGLGVPESHANRMNNRDKKVMVKVHPGLAMWRSILGGAILDAARENGLEAVFVDVTLHSRNLRNALVEGYTSTEGMRKIIDHVRTLGSGLVVGGEGRNEITALGTSFAQEHLFKAYGANIPGVERTGGCPLNHFLMGDICHTIGYSALSGATEAEVLRMRLHREHGTIPTVTIRSAEEITNPNPAVREALEQARG